MQEFQSRTLTQSIENRNIKLQKRKTKLSKTEKG